MKKNWKRTALTAVVLLFAMMLFAVPVSAKAKYKSQWVTNSKGKTFYYTSKGKKAKGVKKIGTKYYYFDSNGVQRTGWQKIKGTYYFFRIKNKAKGYRVCSETVNGIKLGGKGKAKLTSYSRKKLPILVRANEVMQSITNGTMTKKEKLRKAFDYAKSHLRSRNRGGFQNSSSWDSFYANIAFSTGFADCYSYAAYFSYLANAIGYKATVVSSGGHGWAEIGGKVYDPNFSKASNVDSFFGMSYDLSGVGGRPLFKQSRVYLKTV